MKKLYLHLFKNEENISIPFLILSFLAGILSATLLFSIFGNASKALILSTLGL